MPSLCPGRWEPPTVELVQTAGSSLTLRGASPPRATTDKEGLDLVSNVSGRRAKSFKYILP